MDNDLLFDYYIGNDTEKAVFYCIMSIVSIVFLLSQVTLLKITFVSDGEVKE